MGGSISERLTSIESKIQHEKRAFIALAKKVATLSADPSSGVPILASTPTKPAIPVVNRVDRLEALVAEMAKTLVLLQQQTQLTPANIEREAAPGTDAAERLRTLESATQALQQQYAALHERTLTLEARFCALKVLTKEGLTLSAEAAATSSRMTRIDVDGVERLVSSQVRVNNIAVGTPLGTLKAHMSQAGVVDSCLITSPPSPHQQHTKSAILTYRHACDALRAIETLNDTIVDSAGAVKRSKLHVEPYLPPDVAAVAGLVNTDED